MKAKIFDLVKRAGENGIDPDDLFRLVYPDKTVTKHSLYVAVWHINDEIGITGWRITAAGSGRRYKLVTCSVRKVA